MPLHSNVRFTCSSPSDSPTSIEWFKNGTRLDDMDKGVRWTWGPMDGVVSAHAVEWWCVVVRSVHMRQCGGGEVSARAGSVVVCGGHGVMVTNNMTHDHTVSVSYQDKIIIMKKLTY